MDLEQILIWLFVFGFLAAIFIGSALADREESKHLQSIGDTGHLKKT